jgi:hypothetical protein
MKRLSTALVFAAALVGAGAPAQASPINYVVNGDFNVFVPSNGTGGGWTSSNIDGAGGWRGSGGLPGASFILNDAGQPATDPTITQLVTGLTAGATYVLSGNYTNVYGCCGSRGPDTFAIDLDGVLFDRLDYPGTGIWGSFSYNILVADTDLLLGFRAEIFSDDTEYRIDNISLTEAGPAAVPEPTTLALVLSGGVALVRRRIIAARRR